MKKTKTIVAQEPTKILKISKKKLVETHLLKKKSITSWEAIELYGATRLSAIIFTLREEKWDIITKPTTAKDRFDNDITFAKYVLNSKG
jgi:hypothetical protein